MKKLYFFLSTIVSLCVIKAQNVNIPDTNFKTYLLSNSDINKNGDNEIQVSEANTFNGKIDCSGKDIYTLEGIEAFINLKEINCDFNNLSSLDLSKNSSLIALYCMANKLTSLDTSNNKYLVTLSCYSNQIKNLDLRNNLNLVNLNCFQNQLTSLDVSKNLALSVLICDANQLTSLDLSNNLSLEQLECEGNCLTVLDVSKNLALTGFNCGYNQLTNLDVSKNILLGSLSCYFNQLSTLDVSKNTDLRYFSCAGNQLTTLDVKNNLKLIRLGCSFNKLSSLDVSNNKSLDDIYCSSNQLTSLNLKNGTNYLITYFGAINNPNLTCIQVDNVDYANSYSPYKDWQKDALASYSTNCSLSVVDASKNGFTIYPNPIKDYLYFSEEVTSVKITDVLGRILKEFSSKQKSVDLSGLKNGVYLVAAITKDGTKVTRKIIKE